MNGLQSFAICRITHHSGSKSQTQTFISSPKIQQLDLSVTNMYIDSCFTNSLLAARRV